MQSKLKKFERDTRDYQQDRVYTWATERSKQRTFKNRKRYNANASGKTTTETDTQGDTDSSGSGIKDRRPFLGKTGMKDTTTSEGGGATAPTTRSKGKTKT